MGAGGMVFPLIVSFFLGGWQTPDKTAWMIAFIAIGIFTFILTLLQYYFCRERVTEEATNSGLESTNKKISVKQQLKAVVTEKYWWLVIIFYLLFQVSGAFKNLSITYFCSDHFAGTAIGGADGSGAMTIINVLGAIPMAIAMAFIWILSAKFGKRIVCLVGCLIAVGGGTGGVVGQFGDGSIANSYNYGNVTLGEGLVCNNLGGVIGRDMKKSGSQVENVYYLDSSCAYASTNGADERVTAVSAASCWPGVR